MNKDKLIRTVAGKLDKHNNEVRDIVEATFDEIISELKSGNEVQIVGFGAFEVRSRVERIGRNPQTGASLTIPATKTPAFNPGKRLRDAVKGRS